MIYYIGNDETYLKKFDSIVVDEIYDLFSINQIDYCCIKPTPPIMTKYGTYIIPKWFESKYFITTVEMRK